MTHGNGTLNVIDNGANISNLYPALAVNHPVPFIVLFVTEVPQQQGPPLFSYMIAPNSAGISGLAPAPALFHDVEATLALLGVFGSDLQAHPPNQRAF